MLGGFSKNKIVIKGGMGDVGREREKREDSKERREGWVLSFCFWGLNDFSLRLKMKVF